MDHPCPACGESIPSRELAGQPRRRRYRTCPLCGARITVDRLTKRRQVVALVLALVALAMLVVASFAAATWNVVAAVVSCVFLGGWIVYSEREVRFVAYED